MTSIDEQGRPEPTGTGSEWETLTGFLDYQRATLEWKTRGLTDDQLRQRLNHPTEMTLAGILRHLALVENYWFTGILAGQAGRFSDETNWSWDTTDTTGAALRRQWEADVADSQQILHGFAELDDPLSAVFTGRGEPLSLRWVLTHMIEEYARHNGHADLLREAIDGETGE